MPSANKEMIMCMANMHSGKVFQLFTSVSSVIGRSGELQNWIDVSFYSVTGYY